MNQQEPHLKASAEKLIDAYDRMLQRAEHTLGTAAARTESALSQALDTAREKAIELGELTHEEADKVHEYVTHDLYDVGQHLAVEERDVADWLRLNLLLVEKELLDRFSGLAQAAKLELKHLQKARQRLAEWHTGEVTTIGTLRCRHCSELLHFKHTGHIPPCPKCHASVFERAKE
jgi:hypothetical protein